MKIIEFEEFHEGVCKLCAQLTTLSFQKEGKTRNVSPDEIYHYPTEMLLDLCLKFSCDLNERKEELYEVFYSNLRKLISDDMNLEPLSCGKLNLFIDGTMLPLLLARDIWISFIGFPFYHKSWVDVLGKELKGKNCLEIMGGSGILSRLLKERGVDILCTDSYSWDFPKRFTEVVKKDAETAIREYKGQLDYVLVSWPPYSGMDILDALYAMREIHPDAKMIFIGEDYGGNCACDAFFEAVIPRNSELFGSPDSQLEDFEDRINSLYTNFPGMNDLVMIFR